MGSMTPRYNGSVMSIHEYDRSVHAKYFVTDLVHKRRLATHYFYFVNIAMWQGNMTAKNE